LEIITAAFYRMDALLVIQPTVSRIIFHSPHPFIPPQKRDVTVTPTGTHRNFSREGQGLAAMASAECEPVMGVWGADPTTVQRQNPWSGAKSPPEAEGFEAIAHLKKAQQAVQGGGIMLLCSLLIKELMSMMMMIIPRLHDTTGCQTSLTTVLNEQPLFVQPC